jgi:predicted Holliday junction resolvase-like endonuclease
MAFSFRRIGFLMPLSVILLLLVLVNVLLTLGNQSLRQQLTERQQFLTQSIQMEALHREIVTTLAAVVVKTNDPELKTLLTSQGISLGSDPQTAGKK